jgi:hypothetical protein
VSDAANAFPVLVKNITSPASEHQMTTLKGEEYKYKNCCAAYSPLTNAALMITRSGTVKLANCSTGKRTWQTAKIGSEQLDVGDKHWRFCSLGFSKDGYRALALDRRGKMLVTDFTTGERSGSMSLDSLNELSSAELRNAWIGPRRKSLSAT